MSEATFFWNARVDGGIHVGLEADGALLFEDFRNVPEEADPVLNWYVDIVCQSRSMPDSPRGIREWLLELGEEINKQLEVLAQKVAVGVDGGVFPFRHVAKIRHGPSMVRLEIRGSALLRKRTSEIAEHVRALKNSWQKELRRLPKAHAVRSEDG
ncbi:MAG: hypothetical protein L0Y72_24805 [Gemmataceae bacterium]|nr:hypothetical protein [Gemmataceae bacterium]MCI0742266.1 hypothetical protein [Gemmataceae bacterium]